MLLCRVAAVKKLPVHNHSAGYIYFLWDYWTHPGLFENRIPLSRRQRGWGWGSGGVCSLANYSVAYETLNQTESPISVILCVLCLPRQSFFYSYYIQYNLNGSNPDGSFTVDDSNSFFSPYKILPIAQGNKYLSSFFSYLIMKLYIVCTH